jgi:hypothetical protein
MSVTFPHALDPVGGPDLVCETHPGMNDSTNPAAAAAAPVFNNARLETLRKGMLVLDASYIRPGQLPLFGNRNHLRDGCPRSRL